MTTAPRDPLEAIDRIRASIAYLKAGPGSARWLASALDAYLSGAPDGLTFEQAAGIATRRGSRPWWKREAMREQAELIRELRRRLSLVLEAPVGPAEVSHAIDIYASTTWPRDRYRATAPRDYDSLPAESLFELFRIGDPPMSESSFRRVLCAEVPPRDRVSHGGSL